MILRLSLFILLFCIGCRTESKIAKMKLIAEKNKDVVVLSSIIHHHLRKTRYASFTLEDILKYDTLGRITKNFSSIEVGAWPNIWRGGYAVYFKFSKERKQDTIKLTTSERIPPTVKIKKKIGISWVVRDKNFDGVIHYCYPERFYSLREIILRGAKK